MYNDGIDLLERLEKLEKRVCELENRIPCNHNYPRIDTTAGQVCSNCGEVMVAPFTPRETTGFRMHL